MPVGLHYLSDVLIIAAVGLSVAKLGILATGAHALAFNMLSMSLIPAGAVAMAASILAAQESALIPPRHLPGLIATCLMTGLAISLLPAAGIMLLPDDVMAFYVVDASLIPVLREVMPLTALLVPLTTATAILGFILRGMNDGFWVMASGLFSSWLILLPTGRLLAGRMQEADGGAIIAWWYAMMLSVLCLLLLLAGRALWRQRDTSQL